MFSNFKLFMILIIFYFLKNFLEWKIKMTKKGGIIIEVRNEEENQKEK